nr:MAG TPA: hypothetical protein [Caudoviricetes sp.]
MNKSPSTSAFLIWITNNYIRNCCYSNRVI